MSLAELLAMLATAWTRLLIYPAGAAAFAVFWLLRRINKRASVVAEQAPSGSGLSAILAIALPWLGLALMPLPLAADLTRPVDVVVLLSLLEWSRVLAAARELAEAKLARAAAMLNSYPPLILALLLMEHATGSFEAQALLQAPPAEATLTVRLAFWAGALALLLVLPALLGIGPFKAGDAGDMALRLGLKLRGLGFAMLGLCPWLRVIPEGYQWLLPLPMLVYGLLLWQFHRRSCSQAALPWARGLFMLSIGLLLGLLLLHGLRIME